MPPSRGQGDDFGDCKEHSSLLEALNDSHLPLQLSFATEDLASLSPPRVPCFAVCSRYQFLIPALSDIIQYFSIHCIQFSSEMWFEFNNFVLKPNIPIGLLYDLCGQPSLPWQLTIHFQAAPKELSMIRCQSIVDTEKLYFQSLKQAVYLIHGSTRVYYALTVDMQKSLWNDILKADMKHAREMMCSATVIPAQDTDIRNIPVRLYRTHSLIVVQGPIQTKYASQLRDEGDGMDATVTTVAVAVQRLLHMEHHSESESLDFFARHAVLAQGIELPLEAPLGLVWRLFSHLDLFLNLCIAPR